MADETESEWLVLFWCVLALVLSIFILWKYLKPKSTPKPQGSRPQTTEDLKTARLKHFMKSESQTLISSVSHNQETTQTKNGEKDAEKVPEATGKGEEEVETDSVPRDVVRREIPGPGRTGSSSFNFFDAESGSPITRPLTSLEEALHWRPGFDAFNVCSVELRRDDWEAFQGRAKTLVCHDMKGGYIEDRFVQGFSSQNCYNIYHWHLIDIFVYFSHNFVTIPPPCWTNAAHTHSVPVLGTLITEWDDGAKICSEFLVDRRSFETLANQLVDIAEYYGFDGWLVNIENPVQPVQVNNLADFVQYLTQEMHQRLPHSLVIWYDSVTFKGDLKWQDELNASNRLFFDACDGIFLNYNWSQAHLMQSARMARRNRRADVYVGVDTFGRGCYGGGGYNCNKAMAVIKDETLSTALFAPGWVMEKFGAETFPANQNRFWNLLTPYCHTHTPIKSLPFITTFCQGNGHKVFIDGNVVYSEPWTNLSTQQVQPTFSNAFFSVGSKSNLEIACVEHTLEEAFNGGGCLLVKGQARATQESSKGIVRLFKTGLVVSTPLLITFTYKVTCPSREPVHVAVQLHTDRKPTYVLLRPEARERECAGEGGGLEKDEDSLLNKRTKERYGICKSRMITSSPFSAPIGEEHYQAYAPLSSSDCDHVRRVFGVDESREAGVPRWSTRCYLLADEHLTGCTIQEIRLVCVNRTGSADDTDTQGQSKFKLHLGEITILDPRALTQAIPSVTNLRCMDVQWNSADHKHSLTLTLAWDCPVRPEPEERIHHCDVYHVVKQEPTFIGRAFVECYRVCRLTVPEGWSYVEFLVRPTTASGLKSPLEDCSRFQLTWT